MTVQPNEKATEREQIEQESTLRLDVLLVFFASWLLLLLIVFDTGLWILAPLRLLLGLAFVLYLPGYWLTSALFPAEADLKAEERTGLSLGLSIVWVPILALILDRLVGLRLWPIFLGEYLSILLFMMVALFRQSRLPAAQVYVPSLAQRPRLRLSSFPFSEKEVLLGAAVVSIVALLWTAFIPSPQEFMTEFYILGEHNRAEDFPREVEVAEDVEVMVGMTNRERSEQSYRVEVWVEDPWQQVRRQKVKSVGPLRLARGETHEYVLTWQMPWSGQDQKVDLLLFRPDDAVPYRRLHFILNVKPESIVD